MQQTDVMGVGWPKL